MDPLTMLWIAVLLTYPVVCVHSQRNTGDASNDASGSGNVLATLLLSFHPALQYFQGMRHEFPLRHPTSISSRLMTLGNRAAHVAHWLGAKAANKHRTSSLLVAAAARGSRPLQNEPKNKSQEMLQQVIDKALESNAKFFWNIATRYRHGKNIDGSGGAVPQPRTAETLFGLQASWFQNFNQDGSQVTREGNGATEDDVPPLSNFSELSDLPPFILANLLDANRMGYSAPRLVQKHAVPLALAGFDVIASAQTGSGKTIAFMLPLIARVVHAAPLPIRPPLPSLGPEGWVKEADILAMKQEGTTVMPAALILAPTWELVLQIELECAKLFFDAPPPTGGGKWCGCVYGGASAKPQLESIAKGVEILVATPGRLSDFLKQKIVSFVRTDIFVLDEADRMLDMGFEPQLRFIIEATDMPASDARQTLMFSDTFPQAIQRIASRYLRPDFVKLSVGRSSTSLSSISQYVVRARDDRRQKIDELLRLLDPNEKAIVFCEKKYMASWIWQTLEKIWESRGISMRAAVIQGDRTHGQRQTALQSFRKGDVNVLVATDVAARGIDVPSVDHVVQFDLPLSPDEFHKYAQRIGRTKQSGRATSLFTPERANLWRNLHAIFTENSQPLPKWFLELAPINDNS